jgi:hypothetical protein
MGILILHGKTQILKLELLPSTLSESSATACHPGDSCGQTRGIHLVYKVGPAGYDGCPLPKMFRIAEH